MKILIYLHHPAQYHLFKNAIKQLKKNGHECIIFAITKDILTSLLDADGVDYINNFLIRRKNNKVSMALAILKQDWRLLKFCAIHKPDIMLGTSPEICHVGFLLKIPSYIFSEDDANIIMLVAKVSYPFAKGIISPEVCSAGKWEQKKIGYIGYQKLAYLHPNVFKPNKNLIKHNLDLTKPYTVLRLAQLTAYHDSGIDGLKGEVLTRLISLLESYGSVYISSEYTLPESLQKYKLNIDIRYIHHVIYFASLYIGDSQSMAVESAVLGTPSIRFSDFAGRISVLEELENKYQLTIGIHTSDKKKLFNTVERLISTPNFRDDWQQKRKKMLSEKIDVSAFIIWFVENYPESAKIMKENPEYQNRFK